MEKCYNYVYKITNKLNDKFYIGVHRTSNLNDGYMGSGNAIQQSIKKYGIENFLKEILYFFDTIEEAYECESKIVTEELVKNRKCYNLKPGGYGWQTEGLVTVKDNNGNNSIVYKTDARYINGELVSIWVGKKHTDETKKILSEKLSKTSTGSKNSQYGKCWVTKNGTNKSIKKELLEQYLNDGWIKGRKIGNTQKIKTANQCRSWIHKDNIIKFIKTDELDKYLQDGWKRGKSDTSRKYSPQPAKPHYNPFDGKILTEIDGKKILLDKHDKRFITGELKPYAKGKIAVKDCKGNKYYVDVNDPRYLNGEFVRQNQSLNGCVIVRDKTGKCYCVDKNDDRYLSGELTFVTTGLKYKKHK